MRSKKCTKDEMNKPKIFIVLQCSNYDVTLVTSTILIRE